MRYIFICLLFVSCISEKKLAKLCADKYPIKDSIVVIEKIDTSFQYIKGDSIRVPFIVKGDVIYKDTICPSVRCPQITRTKEKIVYQENTAKISLCELEIKDMTQKLKKLSDENSQLKMKVKNRTDHRNILFIIICTIIAFYIIKNKIKKWLQIN